MRALKTMFARFSAWWARDVFDLSPIADLADPNYREGA